MLAYVVRRVIATVPVMAVVAFFVFSLLYIAPGDPAAVIAGDQATPADVERIRQSLGLDRPFLVRFGEWVWQILHGDLGTSIFTNLPVTTMMAQRFEPTLSLMLVTLVFAVAVAVPIGVLAAWKAGTWIDRVVMIFAVVGFSVPGFVLAYILIFTFSVGLDLLPFAGRSLTLYKSAENAFMRMHRTHTCLNVVMLNFILSVLRSESRSWISVSLTRFSFRFLTFASGGSP